MSPESTLIMHPFNALFCAVFAAFLLVFILLGLLLRHRSGETRGRVLVLLCLLTMAGYIAYKFALYRDSDYNHITAAMGGFNWWGELPLHLCNINMILIPIAVLRKSRPLMSFCFFLGPLGAFMALAMPGNGFDGYSLLLPRMLGYYGTHFMIMAEGLALAFFGLYRPRFRDLPKTVLTALIISFVIFCFNLLLRRTGLHPHANYFFTVETEGNPLLELFHRWIPVPYLYILPSVVILGVYMTLVTLPFQLTERKRARTEI